MDPLSLIRIGIETGDMKKVQKGYELMSGKKVVSKPQQVEEDEDEDGGVVRSNFRLGHKSFDEDGNEKKYTKQVQVKIAPRNSFEDKGLHGDKEAIAKTKKPAKKSNIFVQTTCVRCEESFRVDKSLLPVSFNSEGKEKKRPYVCDDCLSSRRK